MKSRSEPYGVKPEIERSDFEYVRIPVHKKHRHDTHAPIHSKEKLLIRKCSCTNGVMQLTDMGKNFEAADVDQLTAHGMLSGIAKM